jgi:hypothetical protein
MDGQMPHAFSDTHAGSPAAGGTQKVSHKHAARIPHAEGVLFQLTNDSFHEMVSNKTLHYCQIGS